MYQGFLSRALTTHGTAEEERGQSVIPLYHFHPLTNISLHLGMWYDYHIFLIVPLIFTRLLLDEIYHLMQLPFVYWWYDIKFLFEYVILWFWLFSYSNLRWEINGFKLASSITIELQAKRGDFFCSICSTLKYLIFVFIFIFDFLNTINR